MVSILYKDHYDFNLNYELVEGDCELFPGIDLLFTPGHSPGHQSIFITMEDGKFIIAGDAINILETDGKIYYYRRKLLFQERKDR